MGNWVDAVYGPPARLWANHRTQQVFATLLVITFLGSLAVIELARQEALPAAIAAQIPRQHFHAIGLVFSFLLFFEVMGLVFGIVDSTSDSVGKQIEIFSIILLRHSFAEFSDLDEPLRWQQLSGMVLRLLEDGVGALIIFVALVAYYRVQKHRPITSDVDQRRRFIEAKKGLALALLVAFAALGLSAGVDLLRGRGSSFFDVFFTLLIFSDILLVLLSLRYTSGYPVVFRNSGFALVTVVLRIALTAPPLPGAALGIGAALYAVGLTLAFNAHAGARSGPAALRKPGEQIDSSRKDGDDR